MYHSIVSLGQSKMIPLTIAELILLYFPPQCMDWLVNYKISLIICKYKYVQQMKKKNQEIESAYTKG